MIETPVFVLEPIAQKWIWQGEAACRGMDSAMFFHPPGERGQTRNGRIAAAKQICQQCPVIADCLEHALRVREPYGVWGGRSEEERALLLGVESLKYPKPGSRAHPAPPAAPPPVSPRCPVPGAEPLSRSHPPTATFTSDGIQR